MGGSSLLGIFQHSPGEDDGGNSRRPFLGTSTPRTGCIPIWACGYGAWQGRQAETDSFISQAAVHREKPGPPAPAKQFQLIAKKIRRPLAHRWRSVYAKRPGRSKSTLLHIASGLSPACPKTTDLSIKVLTAISLWGGSAHRMEDSLHYEPSGPDPSY